MRMTIARFALATIAFCIPMASTASAQTRTDTAARRIADEYIAARGGIAKIQSVRNMILRAKLPNGHERFMARARPYFYLVGEPKPGRDFAEGADGSSWEFYGDPGLVLRTTGAPAAAARHTAYFDDAIVQSLEPGHTLQLLGDDEIGGRPAYKLLATGPDGFAGEVFVDKATHLLVASRISAPIHAFGDAVKTETRIGGWRDVGGALFPMSFREFVIETGKPLTDLGGEWTQVEYNVDLPADYFSPPPLSNDPLKRMLNSAFAARTIPSDALGWYEDFRHDPKTAAIDTHDGIEAVGYQCVKNGSVDAGILLLEANARDYPRVASAHFGLGRAYRAAGREAEAVAQFKAALAIDPTYKRAADALTAGVTPTAASH